MITSAFLGITLPVIILLLTVLFSNNKKDNLLLSICEIMFMLCINLILNYVLPLWHKQEWIFIANGFFTVLTAIWVYLNLSKTNIKREVSIQEDAIDLFLLILISGVVLTGIGLFVILNF